MTILVRIADTRCPTYYQEHTKAVFEVPHLLARISHWYYERHAMPESFDDVVSEVMQALVDAGTFLPKHMDSALRKTLKFGQECTNCRTADPDQPLLCACSCKTEFYCTRECQSEHWNRGHKDTCKAAWQDQITAPIAYGEEEAF